MVISKEKVSVVSEETADVRRLVRAGKQTEDLVTSGVGAIRAQRLAKRLGVDLTNPVFAKVAGLDKLPRVEED